MTDRNFYIRLAGIGRAVYHFPSMNAAGRAGHAVARRQRGGDHSLLLSALGRDGQGQARIFHFYVVFFRISLFPSVVRANRKHRGATERRDAAVRAIRPEGARLAAWRPAGGPLAAMRSDGPRRTVTSLEDTVGALEEKSVQRLGKPG